MAQISNLRFRSDVSKNSQTGFLVSLSQTGFKLKSGVFQAHLKLLKVGFQDHHHELRHLVDFTDYVVGSTGPLKSQNPGFGTLRFGALRNFPI